MFTSDCIAHFISTDIVNFTVISSELTPTGVVEMLDGMYHIFDKIAHRHGVYKVRSCVNN